MDDFEDDLVEEGRDKTSLVKVGGIVVLIAIIAAIAVAGTLYFLDKGSNSTQTKETKVVDQDIVVPTSDTIEDSSTKYYSFEEEFTVPLITNGIETRRQRYLKVGLSVASQSEEALNVIAKHLPKVVNDVEQLLREQDFATMQTMEGKLQLQIALTEVIDALVMKESGGSDSIDKVIFTDFVMQ